MLKLYRDGDQWCALIGENLQEGICGFGDTRFKAIFNMIASALFDH